jgi:hypothetical protein
MLGAVSPRGLAGPQNHRGDALVLELDECPNGDLIALPFAPSGHHDRCVVVLEADQGRDVGTKEPA